MSGAEDRDDRHLEIDVYHHFPDGIAELLQAFLGILTSPIEVVVTSNGNPIHLVLNPQQPQENT